MNRVAAFVRSILPEPPMQLFFLCGSVLLYVSSQLRWWPVEGSQFDRHSLMLSLWHLNGLSGSTIQSWVHTIWAGEILLEIAGSAGLFLCLWPGRRPIRNVLLFVCVPALWAVIVMCIQFSLQSRNFLASVLDKPASSGPSLGETLLWLWQLPGLRFAVVGLLCIFIFLLRMAKRIDPLPVTLPSGSILSSADDAMWRRVWGFVWFSCTYAFVVYRLAETPYVGLYELGVDPAKNPAWKWIFYVQDWTGPAALACVAAWAVGSTRWVELRRFVRLPEPRFVGIALVVGVATWAAIPLATYAYDRFVWANSAHAMLREAPVLEGYFPLPQWELIAIYIVPAFCEEVIYRGYLQPRLVHRYGLLRGLVILGIFWSAFHVHSDFGSRTGNWAWFVFFWRPALCIAHSFVFGWLTIRSGSVIPAAILHGLYNVGISTPVVPHPPLGTILRIVIWATLAYVLFRYWPPIVVEDPRSSCIPAAEEPAI